MQGNLPATSVTKLVHILLTTLQRHVIFVDISEPVKKSNPTKFRSRRKRGLVRDKNDARFKSDSTMTTQIWNHSK